jgi:cell fate regulator YaaT (PSP1 superfamily)
MLTLPCRWCNESFRLFIEDGLWLAMPGACPTGSVAWAFLCFVIIGEASMKYAYHLAVSPGIHYDCLADDTLDLKRGDEVVVRCEHYEDFGVVASCAKEPGPQEKAQKSAGGKGRRVQGQKTPEVLRRATASDKSKAEENEVRAASMQKTAQRKIREHNLAMKLINCHYSFDRSLVVLQFSSEGRVDFRNLLRDLSGTLHARVELRQVGVRDEAAIQGGIGPCGRPFCCATFLQNFVSINVRMAKEQGLSLNPSNISGSCGRLKCCLKYENEGYKILNWSLPKVGTICELPEGDARVIDCNALTQTVRLIMLDSSKQVVEMKVDQIKVKPAAKNTRPERKSGNDDKPAANERSKPSGNEKGRGSGSDRGKPADNGKPSGNNRGRSGASRRRR